MKTLNSVNMWLLSISMLLFSIVSCSEDEDNNLERIQILYIADSTVESGAMPPAPHDYKLPFMQVWEEGSIEIKLLSLNRIEGFEYKEGYEYKLKVLITTIENPPMDGHSEKFKLIELLSKMKVEIEN